MHEKNIIRAGVPEFMVYGVAPTISPLSIGLVKSTDSTDSTDFIVFHHFFFYFRRMKAMLLSFALLSSASLFSQVNTVTSLADSGPGSLRQTVINSSPGDTIQFAAALLNGGSDSIRLNAPIIFNHGLTINGLISGGDTLYLSGKSSSQIFYIDLTSTAATKSVYLNDLTFVNAKSTLYPGGAIYANGLNDFELKRCTFRKNRTDGVDLSGGAVYIQGIHAKVNSCVFKNNATMDLASGGAMQVSVVKSEIRNTLFNSNLASGAGAVRISSGSSHKIIHCHFNYNTSVGLKSGGGLIVSSADSLTVESTDFVGNTSSASAGAMLVLADYALIEGCFLDSNIADSKGGLLFIGDQLRVSGSTFSFNYSVYGVGALHIQDSTAVELINSTFVGNHSYNVSGALYFTQLSNYSVSIKSCTFYLNGSKAQSAQIMFHGGGPFSISSTIIIDKGTSSIYHPLSVPTSLGYNVFMDSPFYKLGSDQINIDSAQINLLPLANYGGLTPTRIPGPNSVALNMGNPNDYSDAQNGPVFGRREVGAAEVSVVVNDTLLGCGPVSWLGSTYSSPGVYVDTLFNANTIDTIGVLVLIRQDTVIVNQNGSLLALEDDPNTTYQWVYCDSAYAPVSGATSSTFSPMVNGNYAVVLNNGTCSDTSACMSYNEVGIEEEESALGFYPNPTRGNITLSPESNLPSSLRIYDLSGRKIEEVEVNSQHVQLPQMQSGLYIFEWRWDSGKRVANKVLVE